MAFADYSQLFSQAEQKYGLRPGTGSALMSLEDASGNPYAKSPAGARGVLQLMPGTASDMGVSNPNDPASNIDGGLHYFSNILNNQAHGDYRTAAMGYNAGPNRSSFPQSSQGYADQFMARMGNANPSQGPYYPQQQPPQPQGQPPMQMPPQSLGQMANGPTSLDTPPFQPQGQSLGALAQGLPQGNIPKPSKFTAGNIMGVLGDALSAYGKMPPTFGPFLREQQMMDKQQGFEREKFQQELAMRMYAMTHPEDVIKADLFNAAPPLEQRAQLKYQDAMHPEYSMTPQGLVLNHRVTDPPDTAVAHLRGALSGGANAAQEKAKFDQIFGPGAADQALGGQ